MIYTEFWDLSFPPFADDGRAETFIPTRSATLAIARLRYSLGREMGASGLFGEAGSGKSRIARMLVDEFLDAGWLAVYLPTPRAAAADILRRLDPASAAVCPPAADGVAELEDMLRGRAGEGQPALIVADDIQSTRNVDFLELLRTLQNIRRDGKAILSILLVGQQAMEKRLAAASGFDTQLVMRAVMEPMSDEETRLYILARLRAAGSRQGIFTRHAADRVVEISRGNPRQVNRLCEMALVIAYGFAQAKITPDTIDMAAADLDLLPAGDALFYPWPHPESADADEEPAELGAPPEEDILASIPAEG